MMGKFSELPKEIVVEIMSRLSPESLLRFKTVEKSWYNLINSLIKDPKFVNTNLHKTNKTNPLCSVFEGLNDSCKCLNKKLTLKIFNDEGLTDSIDVGEELMMIKDNRAGLHLHCNGIICLVHYFSGDIMAFNPLTKQVKHFSFWRFSEMIGFGYDPIANVYKFVKVFSTRGSILEPICFVYTFGEWWREIDGPKMVRSSVDPMIKNQLYCNGVYYWLVATFLKQEMHAFGMHDEKFRVVALPDKFQGTGPYVNYGGSTYLSLWNDSVALLCHSEMFLIEMWVMSGVYGGWNRCSSIIYPGFVQRDRLAQIGFLDTDRLLMRVGNRVVTFNLLTDQVTEIYTANTEDFTVFGFTGSLVSFTSPA